MENMISAEELKAEMRYEPETGQFYWLKSGKGRKPDLKVGTVVSCYGGLQYVHVHLRGKKYSGHRLAWFYVYGNWPPEDIDHIDGNGLNNSIANLRLASRTQNMCNRTAFKNNKSGMKGVYLDRRSGKWRSEIKFNRVRHHLGRYETAEEAYSAYLKAAQRLHGQFATE